MVSSYRLYTLVKYHKKESSDKNRGYLSIPSYLSGLLLKIKSKMEGFLFEIHSFFLE